MNDDLDKLMQAFENFEKEQTQACIQLALNVSHQFLYAVRDSAFRPYQVLYNVLACVKDIEYAKEVFSSVKLCSRVNKDFRKELSLETYLLALAWLRFINLTEAMIIEATQNSPGG